LASVATAPLTDAPEDEEELVLVELAPQPAASSAVAATAATPPTRTLRLSSNIMYSFVARRMARPSRPLFGVTLHAPGVGKQVAVAST
jgi:hypothetical protein